MGGGCGNGGEEDGGFLELLVKREVLRCWWDGGLVG